MKQLKKLKHDLWSRAYRKFRGDKLGVCALVVVLIYFVIALLVWFQVIANEWDELFTEMREPPSLQYWFGTNMNGQDVFQRAVYSTLVAFEVGLVVAVSSTILGTIAGGVAGFFSATWIDEIIVWVFGVIDCMPFYLFVAAVAFALQDNAYAMHIAMVATFWTGTARFIRGEVIKIKSLEYIEATKVLSIPTFRVILKHILPNTLHIILVQISLLFVTAIKSEVILSFLGLGVKDGVSWGLMIAESTAEIAAGDFNNFFAASGFMFVLVIAFNVFSDALQDALDPKKVS